MEGATWQEAENERINPAKQKAKELIKKYKLYLGGERYMDDLDALRCALIFCDEMLKEILENYGFKKRIEYWQQVKKELINLQKDWILNNYFVDS